MDFERRRALAKREVNHGKHIPYAYHLDPHTICTRDGALVQVIQLQGLRSQTMSLKARVDAKKARANLYREVVDPRLTIYSHAIRRPIKLANQARYKDNFFQEMNDRWFDHLNADGLFITENFIALVLRPDWGATAVLRGFFRSLFPKIDETDYKKQQAQTLKELHRLSDKVNRRLNAYNTKRLSVVKRGETEVSEVLSFLHYLVNGDKKQRQLPRSDLAYYLPTNSHTFLLDHFEIRSPVKKRYGAMLAVKEDLYPSTTDQGQLDPLLSLQREFVITQSFQFVDKKTAKDAIKFKQNHMAQANDDAITLHDELDTPIDELESNVIRMGKYHFSVSALADSPQELDATVLDLDRAMAEANMTPVREALNMEAAFWAQLPANESYRARSFPINTKNFSGLASMHGEALGKATGNRWGNAVTVLPTINRSPYYFNFHQAKDEKLDGEGSAKKPSDKGHTSVIGPNGSGKTLFVAFLLIQLQKIKNRIIYFDKDRANEILIRAMGGEYSVLSPDKPAGFNPLQLPDTKINRDFLESWIELMVQASGKEISAADRMQIKDAIVGNYEGLDFADRRLSNVVEFFGAELPGSIREALAPWYGEGSKAYLFDNPEDNFNLSDQVVGMDLTHLMNDTFIQVPVVKYLFHRVKISLDGVTPTVVPFDEGWAYVKNPLLAEGVQDELKTIRKKEGVVVFMTQDPADSAESSIKTTLNQEIVTKIMFGNPRGSKEHYCDYFGLSDAEFNWVTSTDTETRQALVVKDRESVVLDLDMHVLDEFIHILSGRKGNIALMDSLRETYGVEVSQWRDRFLEAVQ